MIAKFDGYCPVSGLRIIAGVSEVVRKGNIWQIKPDNSIAAFKAARERWIAHNGNDNDFINWWSEIQR